MATVSKVFKLGKSQAELDFVDVNVNGDTRLFIDPYALSRRRDRWSYEAHKTLTEFFERVVFAIRDGKDDEAMELLQYLQEPNETRLGLSRGKPQGAGIGDFQADALFDALKSSSAVQTGLIESLEECELMIEGIGWDKISDLATNVIRLHLVEYTREQCALHGIPTHNQPLPAYYDRESGNWVEDYHEIPFAGSGPLVLVPKIIARYKGACNVGSYYNHYVLDFLQAQLLSAGASLVRTLKNGRRVVTKKDLKERFPCTKRFLFEFSKEHPGVLAEYRSALVDIERRGLDATVGNEDQVTLAKALADALRAIPAGNADATSYQTMMMGILEFLFYPSLLYPRKEHEINQGRKRIDIVFNNDADHGVFRWIQAALKLPCAYIVFECKNYTHDIANPELDQLIGRFSPNRGLVGFVCCRNFDNLGLFIERCRDTRKDNHGLVVPMEDDFVIQLLRHVEMGERHKIDETLNGRIDKICMA